jgi:hypothetical protein
MKQDYFIPQDWSDVTIKEYSKFHSAAKIYENIAEFEERIVDLAILHLCHIPKEELMKLSESTRLSIANDMRRLLNSATTQPLVKRFELLGTKFGFIPNLDQMSYGEYLDLVDVCQDTWKNMAMIAAILYRPIVEEQQDKYSIEKYAGTNDDVVAIFNDKLGMDIVFGAVSFFLNLQKELLIDTSIYMMNQTLNQELRNTQLRQDLQRNGVPMQLFQRFQERVSLTLKK